MAGLPLIFVDTFSPVAIMLISLIFQAKDSAAMVNWLSKLGLSAIWRIVLKRRKLHPNKKRFVNFARLPEENYPDYFSALTNRRNYGGKTNN